jgi:hypothetical protein
VICGRGEKVAPEPEQIAVPSVEAGYRSASHLIDLVGDGDARDSRSTDVVVRNQKARSDFGHNANLVPNMHEVGSDGRFDLTHQVEWAQAHVVAMRTTASPTHGTVRSTPQA